MPGPRRPAQLPDELQAIARMAALTGDMVTVILDDQTTVFLSEAGARFLGLDAAAEVGKKSTLPPLHPDDLPRLLATREQRLRTGEPIEVRVRRADGAYRWLELRSFPVVADGVRHLISLSRDIQARKDVEEGIRRTNRDLEVQAVSSQVRTERELRTRAAQQAAIARLSQLALVSPTPQHFFDEAVRLCSEAAGFDACILTEWRSGRAQLTVLGSFGVTSAPVGSELPLGELALTPFVIQLQKPVVVDDWLTEDRFPYPKLGAPGLRTGVAVPVFHGSEVAGALAGHRFKPEPFDSQDVAFLQSIANVVAAFLELQATFEALRRSREGFRALIEEAPDLILVHRGGSIVYGNAVARELVGVDTVAELVGRPLSSLAHPDDRAEIERRVAEPKGPQRRGPPMPVRMSTPGGAERLHELVSLPSSFEGEPAIISFGRDLTERHEMQLRLQLADRMVSVGTLAAGVAHELNNPLAYVTANLQFLGDELHAFGPVLEQTPVAPRLRHAEESLREAYEGASRLRVIVKDLSTFSRGEGETRGPVDLRPVVESSLNMAQNQIRHRATVVRDLQAVPKVLGNAARLGQVALNLLVNAAQAIPEGNAAVNRIEVRTRLAGGMVCFEVKDSGAGIPQRLLGRIFDPFFTTKAPGIGTGLGLSICHSIVTSMGGTIEVESAPGQGTTFRVLLPPTADLPAVAPPPTLPAAATRGKLLVVDDEPLVGLALKRALQREHDVTVLQSGRAALERLRAGEQYDAVVSDLLMPDCTGMELYEALCTLSPALAGKTLFLTGGAFTEGAREFLARPGIRSLEKPFDVDLLRAAVRELVARKPA
jgi:PAS domain S-box-containing protein